MEREKEKLRVGEVMGDENDEYDPVPEITRAHFEEVHISFLVSYV